MYSQLEQTFKNLDITEQILIFKLVDTHAPVFMKLLPGHPLITHAMYNNGDPATDPVIAAYNNWKNTN